MGAQPKRLGVGRVDRVVSSLCVREVSTTSKSADSTPGLEQTALRRAGGGGGDGGDAAADVPVRDTARRYDVAAAVGCRWLPLVAVGCRWLGFRIINSN